ncbi:hypothetical protein [Tenacibaculum sp. 190524A05c]|uniref:toxin-antitoxin system YwqK family antitoxin n=1 Tax=Tenacibaculum platacis TaxID=3137852 RepID=UPI0032B16CEB
MKKSILFLIILIIILQVAHAQEIIEFTDNITVETLEQNNKQRTRNGNWKVTYPGVNRYELGKYVNNNREGKWISYYSNNKIWKIDTYKNGDFQGEFKQYNEKGYLVIKGQYFKGRKAGEWQYYFKVGTLSDIGKYVDGKKQGKWVSYFPNNQSLSKEPRKIIYFKNGKKDGEYISFYANGSVQEKKKYTNDYPVGASYLFHKNGKKSKTIFYDEKGKQIASKNFYESGVLKEKRIFDSIQRVISIETFYATKGLERIKKISYEENNKISKVLEYHKNGELKTKGTQINDKQEGLWESYHKNKELKSKISYVAGKIDGDYKTFYSNGQIEYNGTFARGRKMGKWTLYGGRDYTIIETGHYNEKGKIGQWKYFAKKKHLFKIENYKNGNLDGEYIEYDSYNKGVIRAKGKYVKNKKDGPWIFYDDTGKIIERKRYSMGSFISDK